MTAVEALAELRNRGNQSSLVLLGTGALDFRKTVHECLRALNVQQWTYVAGPTEHVWEWYRASDVVVVPSEQEAFGRVTVEAMLAGRPVVGAASGGTPELMNHGETGLLFAPGEPSELRAQLATLSNATYRTQLGRAGRERARRLFSREVYLERVAGELAGARQPV